MKTPKSFEEGMARLQELLTELQGEDVSLAQSVKLYAEAAKLIEYCSTALDTANRIVTAGGRVLCATAIGASVADAQQQAYRLAEKIRGSGMFYRHDIGYRAIARERGEG